jgi:hypothetical protein
MNVGIVRMFAEYRPGITIIFAGSAGKPAGRIGLALA